MSKSPDWTAALPPGWDVRVARRLFRERRQSSLADDVHLTPSQHHGVLPQAEYMQRTGSRVVLNLTGADNMKHVEPDDFVIHLRSFQGGIEHSPYRGKVSNAYTVFAASCEIEPRYYKWVLKSQPVIEQLASTTDQLRDGQSIKFEQFASLMLPVPPLDEQRRIANYLDDQTTRIDQAIQLRQKQVQLLRLRQASAFVAVLLGGGKQASKDEGWYVGLPSHWAIRPLRQHWKVIDCKHRTPDYIGVGFPVVSPGDITASDLDLSRCHRFVTEADYRDMADDVRRCRQGDIVYGRNASAGTAAYVATDDPFTMGQDVCRITSTGMGQEYLYFALNNIVGPQLEEVRVGSTITRINIDQIRTLMVPVPPRAEQLTIAAACRTIEREGLALSGQLNDSIELLRNRRIALISEAVGGRHAAPAS